jgi:hypothetical protein
MVEILFDFNREAYRAGRERALPKEIEILFFVWSDVHIDVAALLVGRLF